MHNSRNLLVVACLLAGLTPAFAGGMGDPSYILKQKNAICDAQRRGEGPLYPNLCQPEYPPYAQPERGQRPYR